MIDEVHCAVGQSGPGKCWNGFNHIPQLLFLTPQLPNAKSISPINQGQEGHDTQCAEPDRLVPGWHNSEIQGCTCLVPDAVVIAHDYTKPIFPRTQLRIKSFATSARVLPIAIMPVKSVAKLHLLGNEKTRRCVANLEITSQRRKLKTFLCFVLLPVRNNALEVDRRNSLVDREMRRVDHLKNHAVYKPQAPVGRFRSRIERQPTWSGSVQRIEYSCLHDGVWMNPPALDIRGCNLHKSTGCIEP